jgi:Protein of unknown function (DUF1822)
MNIFQDTLTFDVALTESAHQAVKKARSQADSLDRNDPHYLQLLAAYAVDFYCRCMGIHTNFFDRLNSHPAELELNRKAKVGCLPIPADATAVQVSPKVDRTYLGYLAVQFDQFLTKATLIGFVRHPQKSALTLSQLSSLEAFLTDLAPVEFSAWFKQIYEKGWKTCEGALMPSSGLKLSFRSGKSDELTVAETKQEFPKVTGILPIELSSQEIDCCVDLKIAIAQKSEDKTRIEIQVAAREEDFLPEGLQLVVIDESGQTFLEASADSQSRLLELKPFSGKSQEQFTLKAILGDASFTETFVV